MNDFLFKVIFKKDWRCFKINDEFTFKKGINVLVGDQGTGKSSLIYAILSKDNSLIKLICDQKFKTSFHDFEKQNPRSSSRIDSGFQVAALMSSHGQVVNIILDSIKKLNQNEIIFIDEPDMALSVRSIMKLVKLLKTLKNNVILTAHNPFLIKEFDVFSLEHKKWMLGTDFIQTHLD